MSALNVYSYYDAAGFRKYADFDDIVFAGTWASSGSYYATASQVVNYGQSQYICITDSVNRNPAVQPTKWAPTRYWSSFVLIIAGSGTTADSTYQVAVSGSNIAVAAYNLALTAESVAIAGSNMASQALNVLNTGWAGTLHAWVADSAGGKNLSELVFVNGILTAYVP